MVFLFVPQVLATMLPWKGSSTARHTSNNSSRTRETTMKDLEENNTRLDGTRRTMRIDMTPYLHCVFVHYYPLAFESSTRYLS